MAIALILSLIFCNGIMKHLWARPRAFWVVGQNFGVTRERIRQIEAKALRKLRHPSRSRKLKDFLD